MRTAYKGGQRKKALYKTNDFSNKSMNAKIRQGFVTEKLTYNYLNNPWQESLEEHTEIIRPNEREEDDDYGDDYSDDYWHYTAHETPNTSLTII